MAPDEAPGPRRLRPVVRKVGIVLLVAYFLFAFGTFAGVALFEYVPTGIGWLIYPPLAALAWFALETAGDQVQRWWKAAFGFEMLTVVVVAIIAVFSLVIVGCIVLLVRSW